jgi:hypothetical protein
MPDCTTASAMTWFGTSFDPALDAPQRWTPRSTGRSAALEAPQRWTEVPRTLAPLLTAAA